MLGPPREPRFPPPPDSKGSRLNTGHHPKVLSKCTLPRFYDNVNGTMSICIHACIHGYILYINTVDRRTRSQRGLAPNSDVLRGTVPGLGNSQNVQITSRDEVYDRHVLSRQRTHIESCEAEDRERGSRCRMAWRRREQLRSSSQLARRTPQIHV